MPDPIRDAIRLRAYELFERRGRQHGRDWQDWFEAEKAILANFQADTVLHYGPCVLSMRQGKPCAGSVISSFTITGRTSAVG